VGTPSVAFFGTANTLLTVDINASSNGNNTIVAAVPGKKIAFLYGDLVCAGAVTVTWESGGGSILDGPKAFSANGGQIYPEVAHWHFLTLPGEALVLNLSGPVQVGGHCVCGVV